MGAGRFVTAFVKISLPCLAGNDLQWACVGFNHWDGKCVFQVPFTSLKIYKYIKGRSISSQMSGAGNNLYLIRMRLTLWRAFDVVFPSS